MSLSDGYGETDHHNNSISSWLPSDDEMNRLSMKPVYLTGTVVHGFGRGSRELGCPTANIDKESVEQQLPQDFKFGIYYGWAMFTDKSKEGMGKLYKMVASVGICPFYKNKSVSVEVHLIHEFPEDFYGAKLKIVFLGYLRAEKNFSSVDDLIAAIRQDIADAEEALDTSASQAAKMDVFFSRNGDDDHDDDDGDEDAPRLQAPLEISKTI